MQKKKSKEYVIVRNKDAAQSTVPCDSLGALNPLQRPLDVPLIHLGTTSPHDSINPGHAFYFREFKSLLLKVEVIKRLPHCDPRLKQSRNDAILPNVLGGASLYFT